MGKGGLIALRATSLGFVMLTLALSQVLWGSAYRWVAVTEGDNGLRGLTRPQLPGLNLDDSTTFYFFALAVTAFSLWMMARLVASPFGAALRGTRDQARRMNVLGHDVWLIRWITFVYAGFWGAVSGLLFVYYHKYIHPASLSHTSSAEAMLSVIACDKDFEEIRALSIEAGLTPNCQVKFRAKINEIMENYDRKFVLDFRE